VQNDDWTGLKVPTLFGRLKKANAQWSMASITRWDQLVYLKDGLSYFVLEEKDEGVIHRMVDLLHSDACPDLTYLHLGDVDEVGHVHGFDPSVPAYLESIQATDVLVGRLVGALEARVEAHPDEDWLVITTTDHGGSLLDYPNHQGDVGYVLEAWHKGVHGLDQPEHRTIFTFLKQFRSAAGGTKKKSPRKTPSAAAVTAAGLSVVPG
jgi:hypothetical protein